MPETAKLYGSFPDKLANGEIDWDTDDIRLILCSASYVPNQDTHDYYNDITGELPTANGYTLAGKSLTNKGKAYDAATNTWKYTADTVSWPSSTLTARYAVLMKYTGTASTSPLIGYVDFGEDKSTSASNFNVNWATSGIYTGTVT